MSLQFQGAAQGTGDLLGVNSSNQSFLFNTNKVKQRLNVKDFGAKGDGQRIDDGVTTTGTDILTSASGLFVVGDVGKSISVQRVDGNNTQAGTIIAVNSATEIQLSFSVTSSQTDVIAWWGTDDTEAIQDTINYWHDNGKTKSIFLPDGIYIIAGAPQHDIGGLDMFGQLYIPFTGFASGTGDRANLIFEGETPALGFWSHRDQPEAGNVNVPRSKQGTILKSNYTTVETIGSCVIGTNGVGTPYAFNYTCTYFINLQIIVDAKIGGQGPVLGGINMSQCYATHVEHCGVAVDSGLGGSQEPTVGRVTTGINFGPISDDQPNVLSYTNVSGFYIGIVGGEHGYLDYVSILGCFYGLKVNTSGYGLYVTTMQIYWCKNTIWNNSNSYYTYLDIGRLEIEHNILGTYWFDNEYDVVDTNNQIHGIIHSISVNDSMSKNGGNNLLLLNQGQNLPDWTTATRPTPRLVPEGPYTEVKYLIGYNTTTGSLEFYNGTTWETVTST
jgi:hypothetical protein